MWTSKALCRLAKQQSKRQNKLSDSEGAESSNELSDGQGAERWQRNSRTRPLGEREKVMWHEKSLNDNSKRKRRQGQSEEK